MAPSCLGDRKARTCPPRRDPRPPASPSPWARPARGSGRGRSPGGPMATAPRRRPPWALLLVVAAGLTILTALRVRQRHQADARDDDLWPVLRSHLTDDQDVHQLDLMVEEHRGLTAAIQAVDAALTSGVDVTTAARELGEILRGHLDHEEQRVFPLLERHLSRREWRGFLLTERRRRPPRERPEFLTWVLDDASDEDAAAVMIELPRPAHLVYRWLLRPRYVAQRRWPPA